MCGQQRKQYYFSSTHNSRSMICGERASRALKALPPSPANQIKFHAKASVKDRKLAPLLFTHPPISVLVAVLNSGAASA